MTDAERVAELVSQWQELAARGEGLSAEAPCAGCPHLAGPLTEAARGLKAPPGWTGSRRTRPRPQPGPAEDQVCHEDTGQSVPMKFIRVESVIRAIKPLARGRKITARDVVRARKVLDRLMR